MKKILLLISVLFSILSCSNMEEDVSVVDDTAPVVEITSPGAYGVLGQGDLLVEGTITEQNLKSFTIWFDDDKTTSVSIDPGLEWEVIINTRTLSKGVHLLNVEAFDEYNNQGNAFRYIYINPDIPVITVSNPADYSVHGLTDVTVSGTVTLPERIKTFRYIFNNGEYTDIPVEENWDFTLSTRECRSAKYILGIEAIDVDGQKGVSYLYLGVDATTPAIQITDVPPPYTQTGNYAITVSGDDIQEYMYKINDDSWSDPLSVATPITGSNFEDGQYTLYVKGKNSLNTWNTDDNCVEYTWCVDTGAPSGTIAIKNYVTKTYSPNITIENEISGADFMRYSNDMINWSEWEEYTAEKERSLGSDSGTKTVYAEFKDLAENEFSAWTELELDNQVAGFSFLINSGVSDTILNKVDLNITFPGFSTMRFCNDNGVWSEWYPYATLYENWDIGRDLGQHQIQAQFKDAAGNMVEYSDSILLCSYIPDALPEGAEFGSAMAFAESGFSLVFGASGYESNGFPSMGKVFVYRNVGYTYLPFEMSPKDDGGSYNENYAHDIAVSKDGTIVAVAAPLADIGGNTDQGAVYVYHWNDLDLNWVCKKVTASVGDTYDEFASSVALSDDGTVLLVGSPFTDSNGYEDVGVVYLYTYDGSNWGGETKIEAGNQGDDVHFGTSLAMASDGESFVVGAPDKEIALNTLSGAVYYYKKNGGSWDETHLSATDLSANDCLGTHVGISSDGTRIFAIAPEHAFGNGKLYIYSQNGLLWDETIIYNVTSNTNAIANSDICLKGNDTVYISNTDENVYRGIVYKYSWNGSSWTKSTVAFNQREDDYWGASLAFYNDWLFVGSTQVGGTGSVTHVDQ